MFRRVMPITEMKVLGEREVEILMMTSGLKGDGLDLVPEGCDLTNYRLNPIQLWQHSPEFPVGTNDNIRVDGPGIRARTTFAPAGISQKADEVAGLVKAGVVRACSIGFDVRKRERIDPRDGTAGYRATSWELLECSFVSVPLDPAAGVTARQQGGSRAMAEWKCGAARGLDIQAGDPAWDGAAAQAAIFEWAGGDDFDPAKARQGFLAYDASEPKLRGSYKLPFCNVVGGKLEVPKAALRAASGAHGVGAADIDGAREEAQAVLDAYKKKAGIGEDSEERHRSTRPARRVRNGRQAVPLIRGMYGIAQLAYAIECVSDSYRMADIEAAIEGDESKVPAMILVALRQLGDALTAMTVEEVGELLTGTDEDDAVGIGLAPAEAAVILMAKTPAAKRFLAAKFRARAALTAGRAGAALSAANVEKVSTAERHHARALECHRDATEAHANLGDHLDGIRSAHERCRAAVGEIGQTIGTVPPDSETMKAHHEALSRALDGMAEHVDGAGDEHEAMKPAHREIARNVRGASRCLREMDGYEEAAGGGQGAAGANSQVQKSNGVQQDEGSRDLDYRKRQADLIVLTSGAAA